MSCANTALFSKRGNLRKIAFLGSRAIITLSALWREATHRDPWITGELATSPGSIFRSEEIATDIGFKLSRFGGAQGIEVVGKSYKLPREEQYDGHTWGRKKPDIAALCVGKRPAFVTFDQAGYNSFGLFAQGMATAAELIVSGYYGTISCYSDCIDNKMYQNHESCTISVNETGQLRILINWGDEILIGPLLDFCRAEKFLEEEGVEQFRKTA